MFQCSDGTNFEREDWAEMHQKYLNISAWFEVIYTDALEDLDFARFILEHGEEIRNMV